jgi:hypothetical protein
MSPIATPAAGLDMGTPASIRARLPPHTVAIEDDPTITDTNQLGSHHGNKCEKTYMTDYEHGVHISSL